MLDHQELTTWTARLGVAPEQVRRDHLISHLLAGIARIVTDKRVVFLGGTALARTHLRGRRVSEDIDLWAEPAPDAFAVLADTLPGQVRREYPGVRIERDGPAVGSVVARDGTRVRFQVVAYGAEYTRCVAAERRIIDLVYADFAEAVELTVPVVAAFVAMKHLAWAERTTPRDLVDLAGLAAIGALDSGADAVTNCLRGFGVKRYEVDHVPEQTRRAWIAELAHQMRIVPDPDEALDAVRAGWAQGLGWG